MVNVSIHLTHDGKGALYQKAYYSQSALLMLLVNAMNLPVIVAVYSYKLGRGERTTSEKKRRKAKRRTKKINDVLFPMILHLSERNIGV